MAIGKIELLYSDGLKVGWGRTLAFTSHLRASQSIKCTVAGNSEFLL